MFVLSPSRPCDQALRDARQEDGVRRRARLYHGDVRPPTPHPRHPAARQPREIARAAMRRASCRPYGARRLLCAAAFGVAVLLVMVPNRADSTALVLFSRNPTTAAGAREIPPPEPRLDARRVRDIPSSRRRARESRVCGTGWLSLPFRPAPPPPDKKSPFRDAPHSGSNYWQDQSAPFFPRRRQKSTRLYADSTRSHAPIPDESATTPTNHQQTRPTRFRSRRHESPPL